MTPTDRKEAHLATLLLDPAHPQVLAICDLGPALVDVPAASYLMIDGHGDPGTSAEFDLAYETLHPLAAELRRHASCQSGAGPVMLESLWWAGDGHEPGMWTLMASLPDDATIIHLEGALSALRARRQRLPAFHELRFGRLHEGRAVQMVHRGPYCDTGPTLVRLQRFARREGLRLSGLRHEIYLEDPRRTTPCPLETLLRFPVL